MSHRTAPAARIALLAAIFSFFIAQTAMAAGPGTSCPAGPVNLAHSCFEGGDGNVADDGAGLFDWHALRDVATVTADGTGPTDTIFKGGSKEQNPTTWGLVHQSAPGKSDLLAAASFVDTVHTLEGPHVFFYGAFERYTNTGNANLSFELNRIRETFDNDGDPATPPVPVRSEGDLLITYDGNSTNGIRLGACIWHGSARGAADGKAFGWYPLAKYSAAPNPADRIDSNDLCTPIGADTTPAAIAAMNGATLTGVDQDLAAFSPSILHDDFGELAVDLTQVFHDAGVQHGCLSFGAMFLHSRSSDTPTSSMKDYVEPQPLRPAADCGFTVDKTVGVGDAPLRHTTPSDPVFANAGDTLHYEVAVRNTGEIALTPEFDDPDCDAGTIAGPEVTAGDDDASFDPGEVWTWRCTHLLTDDDFGGPFWDADAGQFVNTASVRATAGGFDETQQASAYAEPYGQIVVDKQLTGRFGDDDRAFAFERFFGAAPGPDELPPGEPFELSASESPVVVADVVANSGRPGIRYVVREQRDLLYSLADVSCDDDESSPSAADAESREADIVVSPGETVTCTFTNRRDTGEVTLTKRVEGLADATGTFDLHLGEQLVVDEAQDGSSQTVEVPTGSYTVRETAGDHGSLDRYATSIVCSSDEPGDRGATDGYATSLAGVEVAKDAEIECVVTNRALAIAIAKSGPAYAYDGDTLEFRYRVTNPGAAPLANVRVVDDKCAPVTGPTVEEGNRDALLQPGEVWLYRCAMPAPATAKGAPPLVNTATATGEAGGNSTSARDRHTTAFLHPAIAIAKSGPATALAGSPVKYDLTVTNPGDVSFAAPLVVVTDALCEAPPALVGKGADASPDTLDPGDAWSYSCTVRTSLGQKAVDNVATVAGTDRHGHTVDAQATFTTTLTQPGRGTRPEHVTAGAAKLRGPSGCPVRAQAATVTGKQIRRVTFYLDGKKVRTVRRADRKGHWSVRIDPRGLSYGSHRLKARVEFVRKSRTKARTLSLVFSRCRPNVRPHFTG